MYTILYDSIQLYAIVYDCIQLYQLYTIDYIIPDAQIPSENQGRTKMWDAEFILGCSLPKFENKDLGIFAYFGYYCMNGLVTTINQFI